MATAEDINRLAQQMKEMNDRLVEETNRRTELATQLQEEIGRRERAEARVSQLETGQEQPPSAQPTSLPQQQPPPTVHMPAQPTTAPPAAVPSPAMPLIKVATPDKYEGSRGALAEAYASQVGIYITMNSTLFTTDKSKVLFAISYLTGEAIKWAQPFLHRALDSETPNPITYQEFVHAFEAVFFDSDRQKRAEAALRALKQTKSAAEYTIRFNQLAPATKWELPTLISHYRQGLKSNVRIPMIRDQFDDLDLVEL